MKLQGLVGIMVLESLGLEWYLASLNKGLLQSQKLLLVVMVGGGWTVKEQP